MYSGLEFNSNFGMMHHIKGVLEERFHDEMSPNNS